MTGSMGEQIDQRRSRVYTGGTFDLFHVGHVEFLSACYQLGQRRSLIYASVVVALNTDEFVEQFKGRKPIMSYEEREAVLLACRYVRAVVPNSSGADSKPTIEAVRPGIVAIGSDWSPEAGKDYYAQMQFTPEWLAERDIKLEFVPRVSPQSSTDVKQRVMQRYWFDLASDMAEQLRQSFQHVDRTFAESMRRLTHPE